MRGRTFGNWFFQRSWAARQPRIEQSKPLYYCPSCLARTQRAMPDAELVPLGPPRYCAWCLLQEERRALNAPQEPAAFQTARQMLRMPRLRPIPIQAHPDTRAALN